MGWDGIFAFLLMDCTVGYKESIYSHARSGRLSTNDLILSLTAKNMIFH